MLSMVPGFLAEPRRLPRLVAAMALSVLPMTAPPAVAETLTMAARAQPASETARSERSSFVEPERESTPLSPEACAADYHARLGAIAAGELAALRATKPSVGTIDAQLPGRLLFASARRAAGPYEQPLKAASELAALRGQAKVPSSANSRWIASRIEMDLTDYLTQGPSPYLCSGVANYLETLRRHAEQVGTSPGGRGADIALQKSAATASLHAARLTFAGPPRPTFEPGSRPSDRIAGASSLLLQAEMRFQTDSVGPIRMAGRTPTSQTLVDASDDTTPSLGAPMPLSSPIDRLGAIDGLLDAARRAGVLPADERTPNREAREVVEAALADTTGRPVLVRLAQIRSMLDRRTAHSGGHPALPALEAALADLEALDYLLADSDGRSDPIGTALAATMNAIEAAHAEACRCKA